MPRNRTPPKYYVPVFTVCAVIFGAFIVSDVVRGGGPEWYDIVGLVACGWVAFDSWRKRRKDADAP